MFFLQQGWGMLSLINEFLSEHNDAGVILSPRVCEKPQLESYISGFKRHGGPVLFDPQFYEPRTDLGRILSYPYFTNYSFDTHDFNATLFCEQVIRYQQTLEINTIILPGRYTNSLTDDWLQMQADFAEVGRKEAPQSTIYSTIGLGPDVILNQDSFDTIIDELVNLPVDGAYFVFEHPDNEFLIENEDFIYCLLDATLSITKSGKDVVVGYANQQSLVFAGSGVKGIASGNFRNTRVFDHVNYVDHSGEIRAKDIWYCDGNSLGEYQIPVLSLAFRRRLSSLFGPVTPYCSDLLKNPAGIRWREPDAFRHYLELLYGLWTNLTRLPVSERPAATLKYFEAVQDINDRLTSSGFSFGSRGFHRAVGPTIRALMAFIHDRKDELEIL
jgi:hypothetical protein